MLFLEKGEELRSENKTLTINSPTIFFLFFLTQVQAAQTKTRNASEDFNKYAKEGIERIDEIRHDTTRAMGTSIDKFDKKVEQKASEAKKGLSSWFGGGGSPGSGK